MLQTAINETTVIPKSDKQASKPMRDAAVEGYSVRSYVKIGHKKKYSISCLWLMFMASVVCLWF